MFVGVHVLFFPFTSDFSDFRLQTEMDQEEQLIKNSNNENMCVSLSPQMELILAVGLKLSTKSDIKLPRSYKQRAKDRKKQR